MSRFDICRFKSPPDEELICGICRNVLDEAKESPCRHVFCYVCITRALQEKSKCPICRTSFRERHLKDVLPLVQNMLNKLPMECDNYENGCHTPVPMERYLDHVKNCEYVMVTCQNDPCGKRLLKRDCANHYSTDCEYRTVTCDKGCKCSIYFNERETHNCITALLNLNGELQEKNQQLEKQVEELQSNIAARSEHKNNVNGEDSRGREESLLDSDIGSPIRSPFSYNSNDYNDFDSLSDPFSIATSISLSGISNISDCTDDYRDDDDLWASDRERNSDDEANNEEVVEEFIPMADDIQESGPASDFSGARYFSDLVSSTNDSNDIGQNFSLPHNHRSQVAITASSSNYQDFPSSSTEVRGPSRTGSSSRKRSNPTGDSDSSSTKRLRQGTDTETNNNLPLRRSARLRHIAASPVNDTECVHVPPPVSYLLDVYSNETNSSSDGSWSPSHETPEF